MDIKKRINIKIDKNIKFYLKALTLLFFISISLGFITAQQFPNEAATAVNQATEDISFIKDLNSLDMFLLIAFNNAIKAFAVILLGVLWGIIPVLFIIFNGYAIGIVLAVMLLKTGMASILLGVLPHGIFEIPAVLLAASYGVWLGEMFSKRLRKKEEAFGVHVKSALGKFMKVILPILIGAAFIETFITSWILNTFIS